MTTSVSHDVGGEFAHVYFRGMRLLLTKPEMQELRDVLSNTLAGWGERVECKCSVAYNRRGQYVTDESN